MRSPALILLVSLMASCASVPSHDTITTESLLGEMYDLARLTKAPTLAYRTIQFSSYDRRSSHREAAGWFENADGFGAEPTPGFVSELRAPDNKEGVGLYLLAEVNGPGAIVRGWTAGMEGTLRVYLDGRSKPVFEGKAQTFLRGRTPWFLKSLGVESDTKNAFVQEEADYLPIPFRSGLRVTWEGRVRSLHFYHLQVRVYPRGTRVESFDAEDLHGTALADAVGALVKPSNRLGGEGHDFEVKFDKDNIWSFEVPGDGARAITELRFDLPENCDVPALRNTMLQIAFDDASLPQVEAPLGDFFASGPGIQPHESLPFTVTEDALTCRFVMPFQKGCKITLRSGRDKLALRGRVTVLPWEWSDRSLYFRAKWRVDHELTATVRGHDMPYLVAIGSGRFVGAACMLMNPTPIPTMGGNWWGEGDEKIFVDGEIVPSTFGTGSEDYYNYAWSRPKLFAHPYCGQPLTTGPDTAGYISNHRFQILDDIPFDRSLAFYMELKHHSKTPGFSYARIAYHYARGGLVDDHQPLRLAELYVPVMPSLEPAAKGNARNAQFWKPKEVQGFVEASGPSGRQIRGWTVKKKGERRKLMWPMAKAGKYKFTLVAKKGPGAGSVRLLWNGKPLKLTRKLKGEVVKLRSDMGTDRMRNFYFEEVECLEGDNELIFEAVEPGVIGFDYFWFKGPAVEIPNALEGEDLEVVSKTGGLGTRKQELDSSRWSRGKQLWIRTAEIGEFIEFKLPVKKPGKYRLTVQLTKSWDYGIVQLSVNGKPIGKPIDAFNTEAMEVILAPLQDLGVFDVTDACKLKLEIVGSNKESQASKCFLGLDYALLTPVTKE